jgi:hypothetical protein
VSSNPRINTAYINETSINWKKYENTLPVPKYQAMMAHNGSGVKLHTFITLALHGNDQLHILPLLPLRKGLSVPTM